MANPTYSAMARVFAVVLPVAGVGALIGGKFAHRFVGEQLAAEAITMPDIETIERELKIGLVTAEDAELLRPHAGVIVHRPAGPGLRRQLLLAHMRVAARQSGVPDDQATYAGVGDLAAAKNRELNAELRERNPGLSPAEVNLLAKAEVADPETEFEAAREIKALYELRSDNFFMGNAIRGMLLNAYGWWLVGLIARIAGLALVGVGALLAAIGFRPGGRND